MRKSAFEVAKVCISVEYPSSDFAILAGSASRGEETSTSDLDIIIFESNVKSYRKSFILHGWRIEAFIHNYQSYLLEFERDKQKGRPILGNMISEGILLIDSIESLKVKESAIQHISDGPIPLSKEFIQASRYFMGDLLDDLIDSEIRDEALITINSLSLQVADFILRLNNQWSGRGKGLTRALRSFDEEMNDEFFISLNEFYINNNKKPFVDFVKKVYEPIGGFLFEGFSTE